MAIVPLEKMTLYGAASQKDATIEALQRLGCVHLVGLADSVDEATASDSLQQARTALKYLRECKEQRRQAQREEGFNRQQIVAQVLSLRDEADRLGDERSDLRAAINDMEPWGDFHLPADRAIGDVKFWFWEVPLKDLSDLEPVPFSWYEISRDTRSAFILVLSADDPGDLPGKRCQLDPRPLTDLRIRLAEVEDQLEELHHQRVGLTRWSQRLKNALDDADDSAAREQALRKTLNGDRVYALQGWIPQESGQRLRQFAEENNLALTLELPGSEDNPPTLLHNPERLAGGESLVTFYKTPAYGSWDPSTLSLVSFAIFFAMIMSDAGYGVVLAIGTAILWKRLGRTISGRRGRVMLAAVIAVTIGYGMLCGSYFGVAPPPDSFLGKIAVIDSTSQSLMLPLTIAIGIVHLSLANAARAWACRGRPSALASVGWIVVMFGAALVGVSMSSGVGSDENTVPTIGGALLLVGLAGVFLFSSERPLLSWSPKNHALRIVDGLGGLTGVSGLFGDVLSYLRLFALGLSSAKLSATFNDLGASAWDSAGFGVIAAIAIVLLGHTINLTLGIMSGAVHGLRLICIEFFKWGLPDEGYLFKAFAKKASIS